MTNPAGAIRRQQRAEWWWFPFALVGALLGVVAVNGVMVYDALSTFPGDAGEDGFDLSNAYDRVLAMAAEQAALGWHIGIEADGGRHAVVQATDRAGLGLEHATIAAQAERPLGPKQVTPLVLHAIAAGRLVSEQALPPGRWNVFVTVVQDGRTLTSTERLAVR